MERHEPLVQRDMTVLEDRTHSNRELLAARATLPNALANVSLAVLFGPQTVRSADLTAMRTTWFAIRPALRLKESTGAIFIVVGFRYVVEIHGLAPIQLFFHKSMGLLST